MSLISNAARATLSYVYERNAITLSDGGANDYVGLFGTVQAVSGIVASSISIANIFQQFVKFRPVPGATLLEMQYSQYPFANRAMAANSGSLQPNRISIEMFIDFGPVGIQQLASALGIKTPTINIVHYSMILPFMQAVRQKLHDHVTNGGTFNLITPSQIYFDCLLESLVDNSDQSGGNIGGVHYTFNFIKPIVTTKDAQKILSDVAKTVGSGGARVG